MKAVIGVTILFTIINWFCWFVLGVTDYTIREKLKNFVITEICLIGLVIGCGFITDWR